MPRTFLTLLAVLAVGFSAHSQDVRMDKERYLDKCRGAWAGQMAGVCYGAPYEFRSNGEPILEPLKPWTPERIAEAIGQDDCYVEMTFLEALEKHGLGITPEQAGKAFASTQYQLWHANLIGRSNVRRGLMPPASGHPDNNRHADDIDFQIEADLFGILCPGLPRESNRLCDIFGHIMNYGDGVYGGMFIAGMYAAAYLEDQDVGKVLQAGLACIPGESQYHRCISDVVRWHAETPGDWEGVWRKVEDTWQDDVDCMRGNPFNIDAKLNGAYVAMGLLFGNGDLLKTVEIATRCGQDSDCNASNAAGVLGCMKGYAALGPDWTSGIAAIENTPFSYTSYSFNTLIPACQRVTEAVIRRASGTVAEDHYRIPVQTPEPPATLEQWVRQEALLAEPITAGEIALWNPGWRVVACGRDMDPGLRSDALGREEVLVLHPVDQTTPAVIAAEVAVPDRAGARLAIDAASDPKGDFLLKVFVQDRLAKEEAVDTHGQWKTVAVDLEPWRGRRVVVRVENHATGWSYEAAYLHTIAVK